MTGSIRILTPGPLASMQDLGRPGWAHVGVSPSGAADRGSHALANRLVGNDPGEATIEAILGGLAFTVSTSTVVAVTGAPAPVTLNGRAADLNAPLYLGSGDELRLGVPTTGLRCYLAVAGGIAAPATLGSRSWDSLAGLGPAPLSAGQALPLGHPTGTPTIDAAPLTPLTSTELRLRPLPGPRLDWLDGGLDALAQRTWTVSTRSDRVGVRLEGEPLHRAPDELPSEGMVRGAIQLPPSGLPVIFGSDHPVTGGYPVVAILTERDSDRLTQARPGQAIRLG